ncbi:MULTISPECIES: fluoride efflux transporter CrcB [unclassified Ruegeria]|uniref:fluoride efflux transporter CrcB n=1 Tax=unclassified Ruegeria TaxID=2625375 RepID=UPI001489568B|nr:MULTISPECIES: fluoride efflux transporter CrcB [unclassified Ruegeria]NOD64324.1 fluoride efflux transporter CrcB [Ruegeria sp. HKCCD6109]
MSDLYLHAAFALGGGLGAVARHMLNRMITHELPLSTLVVNVVGCLFLGLWAGYLGEPHLMPEEERRLVFGFCGGFTTFSSFAYQSLQLHRERTILMAAGNILLSVAMCWIAFWFGLQAMW